MPTRVVVSRCRRQLCNIVAAYMAVRRYGLASGQALAALAPTVLHDVTDPPPGRASPRGGASASSKTALQNKFGWLRQHAPCYGLSGKNISVIREPIDFYETFKGMVSGARKRIVIASLYLGTGALEEELVASVDAACRRAAETGDQLEVHILLDFNRGSRGAHNSRSLLLPLLERYRGCVNVYLYHTPDLRGLTKQCLSERFNEVIGLNHMKIYLADDDFIISGANLSDSYFTNRQDRYVQVRACPEMADYLLDLVRAVSQFSFHLQPDDSLTYPHNAPHPYQGSESPDVFKSFAKDIVENMIKEAVSSSKAKTENQSVTGADCDIDTWLFPLVQMGPIGIDDDEKVTQMVFRQSGECDKIHLASGYFNLTNDYVEAIINQSQAKFDILAASPEANGFLGSSGFSGYIPDAYTHIAHQFQAEVCRQCQQHRISLHEYHRPHWTFHCKGLWYYIPECPHPVLTFIGSPNFGYRSSCRDLECQAIIMTANPSLQQQLQKEHEELYSRSLQVTEKTFQQRERYVPVWVRMVTNVVKNFF